MNAKKLLTLNLIVLTVVAVFAISAGSALAQGPQNGRGRGAGANGAGTGVYAGGAYAGNSYGQNLQLHTPGTGIVDPSTSLQLGTGSRYGQNGAAGQGQYGSAGIGLGQNLYALTASGELTDEAIAALTAGLTDEVNAYNAYAQIIAQFGPVSPFVQIQQAEASHMAALEAAFTRYGLPVPEIMPTVEISASSVAEACAIGAQAEIANVALYDGWIDAVSDYPDLVQVFTALRNVSQNNHLPAFEACAG
jgi:hypothetical protein